MHNTQLCMEAGRRGEEWGGGGRREWTVFIQSTTHNPSLLMKLFTCSRVSDIRPGFWTPMTTEHSRALCPEVETSAPTTGMLDNWKGLKMKGNVNRRKTPREKIEQFHSVKSSSHFFLVPFLQLVKATPRRRRRNGQFSSAPAPLQFPR